MRENLPAITTGSQTLHLPKRHVPDVRVLIEHIESIAGSLNALPKNRGLAVSIERVRSEIAEWAERLSADTRIALDRYIEAHPEREEYARQCVDDVMQEFHRKAMAIFRKVESYCCDVYDSVNTKRFTRTLRQRLGIPEMPTDTAEVIERHDVLEGNEFRYFQHSDVVVHTSRKLPAERFMDRLPDAACARLLIDGSRIDDHGRRERFVKGIIESAMNGSGMGDLPRETIDQVMREILTILQDMRSTRNPYMLKVSSRTLLGLLPETPDLDDDDPQGAFTRWRNSRKHNEEDPEEPPVAGDDGLTHNQCGAGRDRVLNGNLVVYMNDGVVEEIESHEDDAESRIAALVSDSALRRPAGIHFYDKHELEETILCLPMDARAVLHLQIRGTDLFCRLYRDREGVLIIEDEEGQFPAALRNTDISAERILANPFEFFSARNMRLEIRSPDRPTG